MAKKSEDENAPKKTGLELAIDSIEKKFGKGSVFLPTDESLPGLSWIPSGCMSLDKALGGGYPRGRIIEVFGPESSGKTTLALTAIAQAQKLDLMCAFVDAEHALEMVYASNLGVDSTKLLVSQPGCGEEALETVDMLVRSNEIGLIVVDSVAALTPQAELEGEMGDSVSAETPVYIRNKYNKYIDIVDIQELYGGSKKFYPGHHTSWYRKFEDLEIFTHQGWKKILGVVKKKNKDNKEIICTRTSTGYVQTTEDHSLFMDNKEISPKEIKIFDRIDINNNIEIINEKQFISEEVAWLMGFWVAEGSTPRSYNCNRFEVCNTRYDLIIKCKDIIEKNFITTTEIRVRTNEEKKDLYILSCTASQELGFLLRKCLLKKSMLKKVPIDILNGKENIKQAFLEGFWLGDGSSSDNKSPLKPKKYHNKGLAVIAGIQYLHSCLGIRANIVVHPSRPWQLTLSENKGRMLRKENEVLQFYKMPAPKLLWDIETEVGTFVTAIGNIICHNSQMGLQARLMSKAMRKLNGIAYDTGTTLLFLNQIRNKIGVLWGSPETTTGGLALKFYASQRLDIRKTGVIGDKEEGKTGVSVKIKVAKNKVAPPFREAEFNINFGEGIDWAKDILDTLISKGVVVKKGADFTIDGERIGYGEAKTVESIRSDKDLLARLKGLL